ncbi:MAG: OadG family protein [Treponema sp.]|nr:OadG family protein [Treponema sp.]
MKIFEMLGQSGVLTLLGVFMVFGFLFIVVISVTIVGKILRLTSSNKDAENQIPAVAPIAMSAKPNAENAAAAVTAAAVPAAIASAVNEYRKTN